MSANQQSGASHKQRCPDCNHENAPQARFCDSCGRALYRVSKARAMLLVEGTAGVGKSTLVNHLIRDVLDPDVRAGTLLHLGQQHTYHPLRPDDIDSPYLAADHEAFLDRIHQMLSFLVSPAPVVGGSAARPTFSCLIETLHLTLAVRPGLLSEEQVLRYDRKLADLGGKLILIQVSDEDLWKRCIWERRHNGFITHYGRRYGRTLTEIHRYYCDEQQRMRDLFDRSGMEKWLLDGGLSPTEAAAEAYRFWMDPGTPSGSVRRV